MQESISIKSQSILAKSPTSTSIFQRQFIPNPSFAQVPKDPSSSFSIVSYNILAKCHLRREYSDYSYTEDKYLDETYRHSLMLKELDYLSGDIVCLQEVNPDFYESTLLQEMVRRGYTGSFIKRTKDSHHEGEATFARTSKFDVIATEGLSLKDLAYVEVDAANLSEEVAGVVKRHLDRPDVILVSKLVCKKTGRQLTVCNIHVVFDLESPGVQCMQITCAINELVKQAGGPLNPHIICGDFNTEPISPGCYLAKNSHLSDSHKHDLEIIPGLESTDGSSRSMFHHLQAAFHHTSNDLKSAYETVVGHEPLLTCYDHSIVQILDFLFYSSSALTVTGVLEFIDKEVVVATGGLPSKDIPSDHLSFKAVLMFS